MHLIRREPAGLLAGLGPGMYVYHVDGMVNVGGVQPIRSGIVALLAEFGLIGLLTTLTVMAILYRSASRGILWIRDSSHYVLHAAALGGMVGSTCMTIGVGSWYQVGLFSGLALASVELATRLLRRSELRHQAEARQALHPLATGTDASPGNCTLDNGTDSREN